MIIDWGQKMPARVLLAGPQRGVLLLAALLLAALLFPLPVAAQDSQFALRALGQPARLLSARVRGAGGAFAPFDPMSGVNPAAAARVSTLTASGTIAGSVRSLEGIEADGSLRATRFPVVSVAGQFFWRSQFAVHAGSYLDRSFDVTTRDTIRVRGVDVPIIDRFTSDGGVSDLTVTLARRMRPNLDVGLAFHGLVGSTRVRVERQFASDDYFSYGERATERYSGIGAAVGAVYVPLEGLALAGYVRSDDELTVTVEGRTPERANLPLTVGGGAQALLGPEVRVAVAAEWRSWSDAPASAGAESFDTFEGSIGVELGPIQRILRFGARYATLPFSPTEQPTEVDVAGGVGLNFAAGRGTLDFTLERGWRSGGRLDEGLWSVVVGLTVRP